jgi:xanthine dehydrogenase accessory factor
MIGSKKKVAATFENLRKADFTEEQISTVFAPIGLSIGAVTPAEIAISILAQVIQEKNKVHAASVDRNLLESTQKGILCLIIQKQGSAPRGVGSMMFVGEHEILGSIGGGEPEYLAISHAKMCQGIETHEYVLNKHTNGLDMICGGTIQVMFIPV